MWVSSALFTTARWTASLWDLIILFICMWHKCRSFDAGGWRWTWSCARPRKMTRYSRGEMCLRCLKRPLLLYKKEARTVRWALESIICCFASIWYWVNRKNGSRPNSLVVVLCSTADFDLILGASIANINNHFVSMSTKKLEIEWVTYYPLNSVSILSC